MKKSELKQILKPLIAECVKDVILEEGVLSRIIVEVAQGLGAAPPPVLESKRNDSLEANKKEREHLSKNNKKKINEARERMMAAVNVGAYGDVDIFEGTQPIAQSDPHSPLAGTGGSDAGIDISKIIGKRNWSGLIK